MSQTEPHPDQSTTDERTTMYAALAFGGFLDAGETERVTVWAAARIERLEVALREILGTQSYCPAPTERPTPWDIARAALDERQADA